MRLACFSRRCKARVASISSCGRKGSSSPMNYQNSVGLTRAQQLENQLFQRAVPCPSSSKSTLIAYLGAFSYRFQSRVQFLAANDRSCVVHCPSAVLFTHGRNATPEVFGVLLPNEKAERTAPVFLQALERARRPGQTRSQGRADSLAPEHRLQRLPATRAAGAAPCHLMGMFRIWLHAANIRLCATGTRPTWSRRATSFKLCEKGLPWGPSGWMRPESRCGEPGGLGTRPASLS